MNPFLSRLGLPDDARALILHVDDVGMCHSSVEAFTQLVANGMVVSGSVMVPPSWFPHIATWARSHAEADLGVHLVLTSEWSTYRWRPLSTTDPATGLIDEEGYLPHTGPKLAGADPDAVLREWRAQVRRARAWGIDLTHLDTHMFSALSPDYFPHYLQLAEEEQLPCLLHREWRDRYGFVNEMRSLGPAAARQWEDEGRPVIDVVELMGATPPEGRLRRTFEIIDAIPAGSLAEILYHPGIDTPELRAAAPDWPERLADFDVLMSDELPRFLEASGITLITWRALRDAMRGAPVTA